MKDLSKLSDAKLSALADELAAKRTEIRLAQVAVADEQQARAALAGLSEGARGRVHELSLSGGVKSKGGVE